MVSENIEENHAANETEDLESIGNDIKLAGVLFRVDTFISAIEEAYLQTEPIHFDYENLKALLIEAKNIGASASFEEVFRIKLKIKQEFNEWVSALGERNNSIKTYHLRIFCDGAKEPVNDETLEALVQFQRMLPHTDLNQSKFDLFLTRLFTKRVDLNIREAIFSRDELVEELRNRFETWPDTEHRIFTPEKREDAIEKFEDFIGEAESYEDFGSIVNENLFGRMRSHKRSIREYLYDPEVAAISVICNITAGNAFALLLSRANEPLNKMLANEFDLGEALSDASDEAESHIQEKLTEISEWVGDDGESGDVNISELLDLTKNEFPKTNEEAAPAKKEIEFVRDRIFASAKKRIAPIISEIDKSEPDLRFLRKELVGIKSLKKSDLNDFLVPLDEPSGKLCREVLGIILLSEDIRKNELPNQKKISTQTQLNLKRILLISKNLAESVEAMIADSEPKQKYRLRIVLNKLIETGLKLKKEIIIVNDPRKEKLPAPESGLKEDKEQSVENETDKVQTPPPQNDKFPANYWLVAATVLIAVVSALIYFYGLKINSTIPTPPNVEKMSVSGLPGGNELEDAYRLGPTLFLTAGESWRNLPEEEQRQHLKELLKLSTKTKLRDVIIVDQKGNFMADASRGGVTIGGSYFQTNAKEKIETDEKNGSD